MSGKLSDLTLEELWDLFPIILKDHSEKYKSWYVDQKLELENLLKNIGVARMSHIGSTAVPGLVSKPTVDILLEIFEDENIDHVVTIVCENGWIKMSEQKSPYLNYSFNKGYTPKGYAEKVFHLHVRHLGDWGELYFCEYLKEHSRVAHDYGLLKEKLALEFPNNRDAYTEGKSDFVKLHTQQARLAFPNKYVLNDKVNRAIQAFNLKVKSIMTVLESYSSTVRVLELVDGKKLVLKVPFNREKLIREVQALELLKGHDLVPEILDYWQGDDSHVGAILMEYIEGQPIQGPVHENLSYELGRLLADLHSVKMDSFELNDIKDDWWLSLEKRFNMWLEEIKEALAPSTYLRIKKCIENFKESQMFVDGPCLVHFDYRPGNILVNDNSIVGVIDFETSRGGEAGADFTKMAHYLWKDNPVLEKAFVKGYESVRPVPAYNETLPIYLLHNAVGGIAWCVRRDKCDDPFYDENSLVLNQMLDYFEHRA